MGDVAFVICFTLLFVFSVYLGFIVGNHWGERALSAGAYWLYNAVAIIVCVVLAAVLTLFPLLYATPLGLLMGAIAGLKMGFGESVGPWKLLDRFFDVNRRQRGAAGAAARAARKRRKAGEKAPDLISVSGDRAQPSAGRAPKTARRTDNHSRNKR